MYTTAFLDNIFYRGKQRRIDAKTAALVLNLAFAFPIIFGVARYVSGSSTFSYAYMLALMLGFISAIAVSDIKATVNKWALLLFISLSLCMVGALSARGGLSVISVFFSCEMLTAFYISYSIVKKRVSIYFAAKLFLLLFWLFFLYKCVTVGSDPDSVNLFLGGGSRNMVSGIALFLQILYSVTYFQRYGRLPVASAFVTFGLCLLAFGRTGIVLSGALCLLTVRPYWSRFGLTERIVFGILFGSVLVALVHPIFSFLIEDTSFKYGLRSPRFTMLREYFSGFSLEALLMGRSFEEMPTVMRFNANPHNSFLYGHHLMGGAYLMFLSVVVLIVIHCLRVAKKRIYGLLLILLMIRAFFDLIAIPGYFDGIFFYILSLALISWHGGSESPRE